MLELFCCPLSEINAPLLERYCELLSADEQRRLAQFKREDARMAFLASRALLRSVLAEKLHCEPRQLQFERDANDKPQLIAQPSWHFNLSHCQGWAALAVSDNSPVGVDIESCDRSNNLLGIAKRFFQPDEHTLLATLPEAERAELFCELWTLKEAMVKAAGLGIGRMLAGVGVSIHNDKIHWRLREDFAGIVQAPTAALYRIEPALRLAVVCVQHIEESAVIHCEVPLLYRRDWKLLPLALS